MALFIGKRKPQQQNQGISIPLKLLGWVRDMDLNDGSDALTWLREAVYLSAPITHPDGNRRYGDLLLTVTDNQLESLSFYVPDCTSCSDTRKFIVYEACMSCNGQCEISECSNSHRREWPCPDCRNIDKREAVMQNGNVYNRGTHKSRR